jgi:DNA-binding beta-propeller fold protein YncE
MRRIYLFLLVLPLAMCLTAGAAWAGTSLYAMDDATNTLYTIDPNTYALTLVGYTGVGTGDFGDMAYDPGSGTAYWIAGRGNDTLYTLNLNTGKATQVGSYGIDDMFALAYDPATHGLYGDATNGNFYSLDPSTGKATLIGSNGVYPGGMTYNSTSGQLILTMAGGTGTFYSIDPTTGKATQLGSPGFLNDNGVAWDADQGAYYVDDWSGNLYKVDPKTWTYKVVSTLNGDAFDGIIYPTGGSGTTPEPGSLLLLGTGIAAVGSRLRRKK